MPWKHSLVCEGVGEVSLERGVAAGPRSHADRASEGTGAASSCLHTGRRRSWLWTFPVLISFLGPFCTEEQEIGEEAFQTEIFDPAFTSFLKSPISSSIPVRIS